MDFLRRVLASLGGRPAAAPAVDERTATVADAPTATVVTDETHTVTLAVKDSVPPVPDASLLYESVLLERDPARSVEVRNGVHVDAARVLAEHGSFDARVRRRLPARWPSRFFKDVAGS